MGIEDTKQVRERLLNRKKVAATAPLPIQLSDVPLTKNVGDLVQGAPCPQGYVAPSRGAAARAFQRLALHFGAGSHVSLVGPAGVGKDSAVEFLCHQTRREFLHLPFREDADSTKYLGQRNIVATTMPDGSTLPETKFVPGPLLQACLGREGRDGIRRPVVILLSDLDRAPPEVTEALKHILQDGRIFIPDGMDSAFEAQVLPGTQFLATMNTNGEGDSSGKYSSALRIDNTVRERFGVWIRSTYMEIEDELVVLKGKFPKVASDHGEALAAALEISKRVREAILKDELFCEWGHRTVAHWIRSMDVRVKRGWELDHLLADSLEDIIDRLTSESRQVVLTIAKPLLNPKEAARIR